MSYIGNDANTGSDYATCSFDDFSGLAQEGGFLRDSPFLLFILLTADVVDLVGHLGGSFVELEEGKHDGKDLIEDVLLVEEIEHIEFHEELKEPDDV